MASPFYAQALLRYCTVYGDVKAHAGKGTPLKIYGYTVAEQGIQTPQPTELAEVTLNASPDELRAMSQFLADCAGEMDRMGSTYDHVHLSDRIKSFRSSPHFVVVRG